MSPDEVMVFILFVICVFVMGVCIAIGVIIDCKLQDEEFDRQEEEFLRTQQELHIKRKAEAETFHQLRRYRDRRIDDEQDSRDTNDTGC